MGKSPPVSSPPEANSTASDPIKVEKRRQRILKNQKLAKNYRVLDKARILQLESQVRQLTQEAAQLQLQAEERAKEGRNKDQVTTARGTFLETITSAADNPAVGDEEIAALIDELADTVGPRGLVFVDCLRTAFQRTVAMMVPEQVLLSLALSEERLVELRNLLQASLSIEQYERFITIQRESASQRLALAEALDGFKAVAGEIWHHSDTLHCLIRSTFKSILRPRQMARMGMRIHTLFKHLQAEKVLNYGSNSSELLQE